MPIEVVTPAAEDAVSLAEAKAHLVVQHTEDDTLITRLISAATRECSNRLNRQLITATLRLWLDCFPRQADPIELRFPPIQSVEAVQYVDVDGDLQTWDDGLYLVDRISEPARIRPAFGQIWPSTRRQYNAVSIECIAGYGDEPADIPQTIRHAVLLLIGHWYLNRESVVVGSISSDVGSTVDALLSGESWGGYLS